MDFIKKNIIIISLTLVGAIGGFLYWKYVGCLSGTCPIKSLWYLSTIWGSALGYLLGSVGMDIYKRFKTKGTSIENES